MKLYNTLTRKVDDFKPQDPSKVTVYTCGPTVYDYPHIGNWFTFIRYDVLIRTLKAAGYKPEWVMNITDVGHLVSDADEGEDKLEKGAKREGKTARNIAKFYSDYFIKGLKRLNITQPDQLPCATDHIQEQINLVKNLDDKGYTYKISDGIYYDTSKFADYGKMAHLDIAHLKEGARVNINPEKHNPTDFALWKFSPKETKRDMEWDSPWGKGFPGWHLECSAMSMKYLGKTLDIHAGGIEHIPIHHTNEIAQSEAVTGQPLAKFWVHMNHILIGGEKIAKSTGNGITLEDIEKKGYSLETLRLLVLESHYRTQAEFSWETLEAAQNRLKDLLALADLKFQANYQTWIINEDEEQTYDGMLSGLIRELTDDLDTPSALSFLSQYSNHIQANGYNTRHFQNFLEGIDNILGLSISQRVDIEPHQKELITNRDIARVNKNWPESDKIRDELQKEGIGLNDTEHGTVWFRLYS